MKLKRYLKIYGALWKNSVVRVMGFKTNFLLWIVVEMLWFALQLSFFAVIYTHTDRIGTWSKWQAVILLASVSFWTVRAQGIVWGYYNLFNIARLPDEAFHGLFKAFFTFALPMLLIANVPARLLVRKLGSPFEMLLLLGMAVICLLVS